MYKNSNTDDILSWRAEKKNLHGSVEINNNLSSLKRDFLVF
jgi:hypothetical protein